MKGLSFLNGGSKNLVKVIPRLLTENILCRPLLPSFFAGNVPLFYALGPSIKSVRSNVGIF